jgi:hypothetical protein
MGFMEPGPIALNGPQPNLPSNCLVYSDKSQEP